VIQGPHVVNIRKGQPRKFDWRKGQKVAKGVTKGLKGAFSSTQQSYSRDLQFAETGAYGTTPLGQEYPGLPKSNPEPAKQSGFGFFGGNPRTAPKPNGLYAPQGNASTPSLLVDAAARKYLLLTSGRNILMSMQSCLVPILSNGQNLRRLTSPPLSSAVLRKWSREVRITFTMSVSCSNLYRHGR